MDDLYKCPDCDWVGKVSEMLADCTGGDDEMWSNWICPKCGGWFRLDDYEKVEEGQGNVQICNPVL